MLHMLCKILIHGPQGLVNCSNPCKSKIYKMSGYLSARHFTHKRFSSKIIRCPSPLNLFSNCEWWASTCMGPNEGFYASSGIGSYKVVVVASLVEVVKSEGTLVGDDLAIFVDLLCLWINGWSFSNSSHSFSTSAATLFFATLFIFCLYLNWVLFIPTLEDLSLFC